MNEINNVLNFYTTYICPVLDVLLLAVVLYSIYKLMAKTQTSQIFRGAFIILLLFAIAFILRLNTMLWLLKIIAPGLVLGVVVVFQPELRKFFFTIGHTEWFHSETRPKQTHIDTVVTAAEILSEHRRGMLVIFSKKNSLKDIVDTGTRINSELSSNLLVTIFGHDTALHDGAVVVQNGKLIAAGCLLPLSEQSDIKKSFGTRHRAALGICETTDAVALIVSEESGALSLAYDSNLYYDLSSKTIIKRLESVLNLKNKIMESDMDGENEI
ncbi:MAG: TIGR00159 family protein [Treponema sp.]|nr:MAG: TIGR00159 family protein [Treponema sp.]